MAFPMLDARGNIIGIHFRSEDGGKFAATGGRQGLHIPANLGKPRLLVLTEGPTDCAAMLDIGFAAVGRPSCTGATEITIELVKKLRPELVVVLGDNDPPDRNGRRPGYEGAGFGFGMAVHAKRVKLLLPPKRIKDAREWKLAGATRADVKKAIDAAPSIRLKLHTEIAAEATK